jgi:hypothetical protein
MTEPRRHPDVLTDAEAAAYLRLIDVADSPAGALRVLERLRGQGRIHALKWAKGFLYAKPDLDAFVEAEIAALTEPAP